MVHGPVPLQPPSQMKAQPDERVVVTVTMMLLEDDAEQTMPAGLLPTVSMPAPVLKGNPCFSHDHIVAILLGTLKSTCPSRTRRD